MRRGLLLSLLLVGVQPLAAHAGEYYWGLMIGSATFEQGSDEYQIGMTTVRGGYRLNNYLGAEVRGGLSMGSDEVTDVYGNKIEFDVNQIGSAFIKAMWSPVDDHRIELYALGGYSTAEMKASAPGVSVTATKSGPAYGVGMDLYASNRHGIYFEWTNLQEGKFRGVDFTLSHVGLGYIRYF